MSQQQDDDGWTLIKRNKPRPKKKSKPDPEPQPDRDESYGQLSTNFQDWKTITFRKRPKPQKVLTQRSMLSTNQSRHLTKIDNQEDAQSLKKINPNLSRKLKSYRNRNHLSQNDLAKMMNLPASTIRGYESGKSINDIQTTQKINNFLNKHPNPPKQ